MVVDHVTGWSLCQLLYSIVLTDTWNLADLQPIRDATVDYCGLAVTVCDDRILAQCILFKLLSVLRGIKCVGLVHHELWMVLLISQYHTWTNIIQNQCLHRVAILHNAGHTYLACVDGLYSHFGYISGHESAGYEKTCSVLYQVKLGSSH